MKATEIIVENAPAIDGLKFRHFAGKSDYPKMLTILEKASEADDDEFASTLDDLEHDYSHLTNCDPKEDMILAEVNGQTVAYGRVSWHQIDKNKNRIYSQFIKIIAEWRDMGIEQAMMAWNEKRLQTISAEHPNDGKRFYQTYSLENKVSLNAILKDMGYEPTRYFFEMNRPLDEIAEAVLPEGIEVRPAKKEDYRKIWDASIDAFRDHWGFSEPEEEDYISYSTSRYFQPDLWQVAWDGDEVVASILNYIDEEYNKKFNKKCGWTEEISTRREWRRKGIATALIARSMQMHKDHGMTMVALGVDTENPNGALQLYEGLGYKKIRTMITFRKEIAA
ncbi:MAG: GNAT family N-acetyltransferase [Anaerolineaceae bacterium]|nr:GNAT family N-acetyltransferase [Anaerolineaceae bacterium]